MPTDSQQVVFQEYIHVIKETTDRVERLTKQIKALDPAWPVGTALLSHRGVSIIVAATIIAELGDLTRFKPHKPAKPEPNRVKQ